MKKLTLVLFILLIVTNTLKAQYNLDSTGKELQKIAVLIQSDSSTKERFKQDSVFTRALIQVLKNPYSFNYKLDSLISIQKLIAPDHKFKLFSWQLDLGDGTYRQRAAIQFPTKDGSLKLLPFFDASDFNNTPTKGINNRKNWMGALYYQIIPVSFKQQNYYTLLGYDEYNLTVSRKIIEVMHFENDEPIFGGDFFEYPKDETYPVAPIDRFIYNYKKGSGANIYFNSESNKLILSELTSTEKDLKVSSTLVPSGNEVYFEWKNGKWVMHPKSSAKK